MAKLKAEQLTQEQIDAINNYSNDIKTLKDTVTAIRKLPGMYAAGTGAIGFKSLIREIYQNAIDQAIDPTSPGNWVKVKYDMQRLLTRVSDNGKGIPYDKMVSSMTEQHTSKNYDKQLGQYSSGLHGSGAKVVNALSSEFHVISYRYDGTAKAIDMREGYIEKGPYDIPNKEKIQGTTVSFIPSLEVMGDCMLDWKEVYTLIRQILSLTPIGTIVEFEAIDLNGVAHIENMVNKDGIITELINTVRTPIIKPIIISLDNGYYKLDLAFTYDGGTESSPPSSIEYITAFCNMSPTNKGDHIDGVIEGICRWFSKYMNDIFLSNQKNNKNPLKITYADIKTGLNCMISGFCLEPIFVGQAKQELNVPEMKNFCITTIVNSLEEWAKNNTGDLSKLCRFFKDIAEARLKMDKEKVKIVTKYQANSLTGLPQKYVKPSKECKELIICEGDSAAGTIKLARNVYQQGLMPIRGKVPSAYSTGKQKFWDNEETQGIARIILGKDYTRNFDVRDVKWEKIIFMADADRP